MFSKLISSISSIILRKFWARNNNTKESSSQSETICKLENSSTTMYQSDTLLITESVESIASIYASTTTSIASFYVSFTDYENARNKCECLEIIDLNYSPTIKPRSKLTNTRNEQILTGDAINRK